MYTIYYTVYSIHYTQYTVYSIHYNTLLYTLYIIHCIVGSGVARGGLWGRAALGGGKIGAILKKRAILK